MRNLRKAQGTLRLGEKYGQEEMERACERALLFGNYRYRSLKNILEMGLSKPAFKTRGCAFYKPPVSSRSKLLKAHYLFRPGGASMNIEHHIAQQLKTLRLGGLLETLDLRLTQALEE